MNHFIYMLMLEERMEICAYEKESVCVKEICLGIKYWYKCGQLHRENGPAVEWPGKYEEWWLYGKKHRIGQPAVSNGYGYEAWWENGERHREHKPAVIMESGDVEYWYKGRLVTKQGMEIIMGEWSKNGKNTKC